MSLLVFAGGAQFAAVELWTHPAPVLALAFSTLLINARHVLMGASLAPKMKGFSLPQRLGAFYFFTDESWALAERRAMRQPITPAYWFALALMLPLAWIGATFLGAWSVLSRRPGTGSAPTSRSPPCSSGWSPDSGKVASLHLPSPRAGGFPR